MVQSPLLRVQDLTKVFRSRKRSVTAVDRVSFEIHRGEVLGILGPNGAGKTTTIKCLCTLIHPTSGRIELLGQDLLRNPRFALSKIAAVLEGNRNVYWRLTARENLEFFAGLQGIPLKAVRSHIDELIELFALGEKRDTPARMLSRGMQQKLAVACALVKGTDILILDEPTLGLDVETSYELRNLLKRTAHENERTILLSSHDMGVVEDICDRVIIVHEGRVVTDDRVSNLLDLFRARAYRFRLEGSLEEDQQAELRKIFEFIEITKTGDDSEIDVELLDPNDFYRLVDVIKRNGTLIQSIDKEDPNLEEIFLRIVKGDR